jgi:hypothetical protein
MTSTSIPEGPGSVSGAPNLPDGFADRFTSRYVHTVEVILTAAAAVERPTAAGAR